MSSSGKLTTGGTVTDAAVAALIGATGTKAALDAGYAPVGEPAAASEATRAGAAEALREPIDPNRLTVGEETQPRFGVIAAVAMTSGILRFTYLTARKTETTSSVRIVSGTAAGASPTLVRAGVWAVQANGDLVPVATTPNDTTLLATASTPYTKGLSVPFAKVARTRYAVGVLVVTAQTAPTLGGASLTAGSDAAQAPRIAASLTAQTDLPAGTITSGSLASGTNTVYAVLVP
jgi:hypothetical protein